ncbi:death ligand signal enhancer [Callorhinchus milii]|uniref:death ligand signal enhancer n=1 Tax=Callorhinchus milii TaxID=7868 RepID=UPI001C3F7CC1|nr:death ligand signal enhancer [Callorhinchus milii]
MWRLKALVVRALHRWHITGPPPPLRLPPSHHADDDSLNPSSLISGRFTLDSSSAKSQHGETGGGRQKTKEEGFRFYSSHLPRYSGLDAVGWGAAAVVFVHLAKHIHQQLSHKPRQRESHRGSVLCVRNIIASALDQDRIGCCRSVLPRVVLAHAVRGSTGGRSDSGGESSHSEGEAALGTSAEQPHPSLNVHSGDVLFVDDVENFTSGAEGEEEERGNVTKEESNPDEVLQQAASHMDTVVGSSISSIINIIGIQNAKAKDDEAAFSCFKLAASQGSAKAQYNVGVCYELGKGISKDMTKAALYYSYAAAQGHSRAQYCWGRHLLHGKTGSETRDTRRALEQLEKAAKSGLKEAQAHLGVVYSEGPHRDQRKSIMYLRMAADNGDSCSQYHLGLCYQQGWGVQTDVRQAAELYHKAAASGHRDAQCALGALYQQGLGGLAVDYQRALELYQRAARAGSEEAAENLQHLMEDLHINDLHPRHREGAALKCVVSWPCLSALSGPQPRHSPGPSSLTDIGWSLSHSRSTGNLCLPLASKASLSHRPELLTANIASLDPRGAFPLSHPTGCGIKGVG